MDIVMGAKFDLGYGKYGKITEIFALGFNFHTFDSRDNCISGQQYMLKDGFNGKEI